MTEPLRPAQPPVFDSRLVGPQYWLTTMVNDEVETWQRPIDDPFVRVIITGRRTFFGRLWDLFRKQEIVVMLGTVNPQLCEAVLELDDNYRGIPGSARRLDAEAAMHDALRSFTDPVDAGFLRDVNRGLTVTETGESILGADTSVAGDHGVARRPLL